MKKMFSLVLALVMALSLTTVAWGATVANEIDLNTAITAGGEVVLGGDVEITTTITISNTVVVDLAGYKLTGPDDGSANWYAFVVGPGGKLTLKDSSAAQTGVLFAKCYGVETKGGTFVMESGKIDATTNGGIGAAIVNYGGTVIVNGGELVASNWAVNAQSYFADATVEINGGTLETTSATEAAIQVGKEYSNTTETVTINGGEIIGDKAVSVDKDTADVTIAGGDVEGTVAASAGDLAISGGTFTDDVSEYVAAGKVFVNGEVQKATPAGNTISYNVKDLTVTKPDGTKEDTTAITSVIKVSSVTNTSTVNGVTKTTFVPAYYQLAAGSSAATYVECDKSVADYMFTIKNVGSVFVREMAVPAAFDATPAALYTAPKTATCGKVGANEDVYVVVDGKYYATDYTVVPGAESYALVNGKMVVYYGEATAKGHNWLQATKESYDTKTGVITSVKCPDCKGVVAVFVKAGSFDGKTYVKITEGVAANYFYVAGTVTTQAPVTGTTSSTVTSAQTFDAGIAMYVGMSVMAAAGSAVVIGKKKD